MAHAARTGRRGRASLPSQLWADAVNDAYDAGVIICAAAGNHFKIGPLRTPDTVVYPARFALTIAVSKITRNNARYRFDDGRMSGNDGLQIDLSAPTPDIMWAQVERRDGELRYGYGPSGGISSATPQVAGTAALWLSMHKDALDGGGFEGWQRVELCRRALQYGAIDAGNKTYWYAEGTSRTRNPCFGDGRLNIPRTLTWTPERLIKDKPPLTKHKEASIGWALWKILSGRSAPAQGDSALLPTPDDLRKMWADAARAT